MSSFNGRNINVSVRQQNENIEIIKILVKFPLKVYLESILHNIFKKFTTQL